MASFKYNLQKPYDVSNSGEKKPSRKETRVYLFVIHDRDNVAKLKTEYSLKPIHWDFNEKRVKHQVTGSKAINDPLDALRTSVENEYNRIRADFPEMKFPEIIQNLKVFVRENVSPVYNEKHKAFFNVFDEYIDAKLDNVSERTIQKYQTLKRSLQGFSPDLTFDKIDMKFYDKYTRYLRAITPQGRQKSRPEGLQSGLLNDTLAKYIENLKNFMKWSYEREYHTNKIYEHSGFKAERKPKNDIVTLFVDELNHFYKYDFINNPRLEKVRDVFCFACFTGQRWSDIEAFNKKDISGDVWQFESYKTKKTITVPLVGYASAALGILHKYNYELPTISAQKFNEYLKEAARIAELDRMVQIKRYKGKSEILIEKPVHEFMSSHMARRTAVSILLNVEKMPLHLVREITGHESLATLDKYLDKDPEALRKSLAGTKSVSAVMEIVKKDAI